MTCPTCGGASRVPVALGYWRCTSSVARSRIVSVPIVPGMPESGLRLEQQIYYEPCGFEYQEVSAPMSDIPVCACGMFSIGACKTCGTYACGRHGRLFGDSFLCWEHVQIAEKAVTVQAELARAEAQQRYLPPPPPKTLAEAIHSIGGVRSQNPPLRAKSTNNEDARAREIAEELLPRLIGLIREVLAMQGSESVHYYVYGEIRGRKWGSAHAEDTARIGTHVEGSDRVVKSGTSGGSWRPLSVYTGVWPAMMWLRGWSGQRTRGDMQEPLLGSLWFNENGMIAAGTGMPYWASKNGDTKPGISLRTSYASRPLGHICAESGSVAPSSDIFGPVSVDGLSIEQLIPICSAAQSRPTLAYKSLARIVSGLTPEPESEGE